MHIDKHTYLEIKKLSRENSPDLIRTYLANERTFLSFIRTALTIFIVGVTFIKFLDVLALEIIGWAFIPIGIITFFVGLVRYIRVKLLIEAFKKELVTKTGSGGQEQN
jgi:uncharacterized membrane protein YidH (DUF202 family)